MLDNFRASLEDFKQFNNFDLIEDKIKFILNYAILAPSTHNSQPWLFKIVDNSCEIYKNPEKQLPEADVDGRDLYISLGCCIENLEIAASYFGIYKSIKYAGKNKRNLVATVYFEVKHVKFNEQYKQLLRAVVYRLNVRGLFSKKNIDKSDLVFLRKIHNIGITANFITDRTKLKKIAELTAKGLRLAHSKQDFKDEMSRWVNNNFSKRREGIPGYSLRMPNLFSIAFPFLVRKFNMGKKLSGLNYISMMSAPVVCIVSSNLDYPEGWIKVGQMSERIMLESYNRGLRTSIFVASIEIGDLYKEIQKLLGLKERPQFVFCIGYMKLNQKYTPRLPLQDKFL